MTANEAWADRSVHTATFVSVNGVRLHMLDWHGQGETLLFLPGFGNTAHIFDDVAPHFTDHYHVVGLSRRGHGQSDIPDSGYDTDTLVEDIRQVLDRMQVMRVHLIGHSMAGAEMTRLATRYPDRVASIIYLDAAYDFSNVRAIWENDPVPPTAPPTDDDCTSFASLAPYYQQQLGFWSPAQEADLRAVYERRPHGLLQFRMPDAVNQALRAGYEAADLDYTGLHVPALAIYAVYDMYPFLPVDADETLRAHAQAFFDQSPKVWQRREIERFQHETARGQVLELLGANHLCFIDRQDVVVHTVKEFLKIA